MKTLNKKAAAIFFKIIEKLNEENEHAIKLNADESFMPLCAEKIGTDYYSFAHYGKQNGDAMKDPDVTFILRDIDGVKSVIPCTYENSYAGHYDEAVVLEGDFKIKGFYRKRQAGITSFCNDWMLNIAHQQNITV